MSRCNSAFLDIWFTKNFWHSLLLRSPEYRSLPWVIISIRTIANTPQVGRLAWSIDESRLAEEFAKFGSIQSTKVIKDRMTGRSKGFGYVEFSSPDEAKSALSMSGTEIEGFAINVDISQPRQAPSAPRNYQPAPSYGGGQQSGGSFGAPRERREYPKSEPSTTVFIGNLSFNATEQDIAGLFGSCGSIQQIRLPRYHDTGKMKGYAYLEFADVESATRCVQMGEQTAGGVMVAGRAVRLDYSQPRAERTSYNQSAAPAGLDSQDGGAPQQY